MYPILFACVAIFIWLTGRALPARVAAHFDAGGGANGFLPHDAYLTGALGFAVALPLLLVLVTRAALARPAAQLNLPRRDYWLAPSHRADTVAFLNSWIARFGAQLAILACFVHWLIVRANRVEPPHLASSPFYAALIAFGIAIVVWLNAFFNRFRSPE
jgi:hypothetical protein